MRLTAVTAGLLLCLGATQGFPVAPRPEVVSYSSESSLMRVVKGIATPLQRDLDLGEIFATHHNTRRRLPVEDQGFGSAPTTGWGDAPQSGIGDAPQTGMGSKPKTRLGGKPKTKVGKKPKHGKGAKPKQKMGEKPRGFCKDCPPPVRIASPANNVPDSTSNATGGFLTDRVMQSGSQSWGKREAIPEGLNHQERRAEDDLGESSKPSGDIVWDKRAASRIIPSKSTSKENEYEWQRREELPEAPASAEDVRLNDGVPISTDAAEQLALTNDYDWSRRSPESADPAKRDEGRLPAAAGAKWGGVGAVPETPASDTDPERKGHSNGFITVDKRAPPSRDHSDILWEFIPEDQIRLGSV